MVQRASARRPVIAVDCETDPFLYGRTPEPFLWGAFDGTTYQTFDTTDAFVAAFKDRDCILYAHNGGKFDFLFLLPYINSTRVKIIGGRVASMKLGKAELRDSFSIIPVPLEQYRKTKIDYRKFERDIRAAHMDEIKYYLRDDVMALYELVNTYREQVGTKLTIAANALASARALDIPVVKTNKRFDRLFREFYYGGRVEARHPGHHTNVNVYDIKSAYPFAMTHQHPATPDFVTFDDIDKITEDEIGPSFIELIGYSDGAFPRRDAAGLTFPRALGRYFVTGWEFLAATKHGLLKTHKIEAVHTFAETADMTSYVNHWFAEKQKAENAGDKAGRLIAKLLLNSLYGKFAQNPEKYFDYELHPVGTAVDMDNGWLLDAQVGQYELHSRPALYRIKQDDEWDKYPAFYNVATAASITGFTRAHLLASMVAVGLERIYYVDTDCLFVGAGGDTFALRQDNKLGSWEWQGLAGECHIAGKKLYAMRYSNGPKSGQDQLAHKGAALTFDQIVKITDGETITWKNDAPSMSIKSGVSFVARTIRKTAGV